MATASHQVLPLCCSASIRPAVSFAALKAWVSGDVSDRTMTGQRLRIRIPDGPPLFQPVGADGYV